MNATQLIPDLTATLGWTLLNSLWQALIVLGLLYIMLRAIPASASRLRYAAACASLVLMLAANITTFIYLSSQQTVTPLTTEAGTIAGVEKTAVDKDLGQTIAAASVVESIYRFVSSNMSLFILCWVIGAILFSLRMVSGWWYLSNLRSDARIVNDEWARRLEALAVRMRIDRVVTLAQSAQVHAPMVIGWLKPMVIVPVGMFSGLSTEQVETIFIHELAHVRRHDYIANLLQCFVESLYFFNPFVWIISAWIRREREYCCDDAVINEQKNPLAYARALACLEEARLAPHSLALSLAESKNQLLDRIKRLMEKSAKQYSARERVIPAVLLIVGLVCASWLTIGSSRPQQQDDGISEDTLKKNKSVRASRSHVIIYDQNGEPHEIITESFEGDDEFRPAMAYAFGDPVTPPSPMDEVSPAEFPPFPAIAPTPATPFGYYHFDSIPAVRFRGRADEWMEFNKAFREKFSEQFGDFYKKNGKEFDKMMEELKQNFENNFNQMNWSGFPADVHDFAELEKMAAKIHELSADDMHIAEEQAIEAQKIFEAQFESMKDHELQFKELQDNLVAMNMGLTGMEDDLRRLEADTRIFETELKAMLVDDGYLKNDEAIKDVHFENNGDIEVNGKKIKAEHRARYKTLHDKFFSGRFHRIAE